MKTIEKEHAWIAEVLVDVLSYATKHNLSEVIDELLEPTQRIGHMADSRKFPNTAPSGHETAEQSQSIVSLKRRPAYLGSS